MMKKLSLHVFLVLMWCNVGFAEELSVNGLLQDGYKISKEELIKGEGTRGLKIITLTKGKSGYAICSIRISSSMGPSSAKCVKP